MPRKARNNVISNYLHIIVQGINKSYIFKNVEEKEKYKSILKKNIIETDVKLLAYCIMDNHTHILVYEDNIEKISKLMQKTNTSYAKFYNLKNKRVGFVFRDRYYTQPILTAKQLLNCLAYIHNNPVKANMVKSAREYKYSSYAEYIGKKDLISEDAIKLIFGTYENYINSFNRIHNKQADNDIIDVMDNYRSSMEIIQDIVNKSKKTIDEIKKDKKLFGKLLIDLKNMGGMSLRDMSKIFNISKDTLARIINKTLQEKNG